MGPTEAIASGPKRLSLWDAISIVIGIVIGSGIFLVPSNILKTMGTPESLLAVWLAAGALSLFGALSYGELGAIFPNAGGQYVYLREAYGPLCAFLYGWSLFLAAQSGSIAAVAVGFATYLGQFIPLGFTVIELSIPVHVVISGTQVCAALLVMFLSVVNYLGLKYGSATQNIFTVLKSAACISIVALALVAGQRPVSELMSGGQSAAGAGYWGCFGVALVAALWALDGWNNVTFISAETKNPRRNIPLALALGTGAVVLIYILMNLAYLRMLDVAHIAASERVAADAVEPALGAWGADLVAAAIMLSSFGCVNGMILAGARVYQAQAEDRLFPRSMVRIHPRFGTPSFSLLAQGVWSALLALSGTYEQLFTFAIFALWVFYGLSVAALFLFRHRGMRSDGYRVWGYPFVPAAFLLLCVWLLINTLVESPWESLIGIGIILAGLPAYALFRRAGERAPPAL